MDNYKVEVQDIVCDYGIYINGVLQDQMIFAQRKNAEIVANVLIQEHNDRMTFESRMVEV